MRKASLVEAKAHLSEFVDAAEHRGQRVLILRHGKPAAAIVPVDYPQSRRRNRTPGRMSPDDFRGLMDRMAEVASACTMSVAEALGRDCLDFDPLTMRLVLDASVAIASVRPSEPAYKASRKRIERCQRGDDLIVVPSFFVVEVSGALARLGVAEADVRALVRDLTRAPHEVVTVGPRAAAAAQSVAIASRLRGPDALYVWLAAREGVPVCTLDKDSRRGAPPSRA